MATKYNEEEYDKLILAYNEAKKLGEQSLWDRAEYAHEAASKYGGLKDFADKTGDGYDTLKTASSMVGKYDKAHREFKSSSGYTVTYKHFIVAASSDSRYVWLQKAADNRWSAEVMRKEMNVDKPKKDKKTSPAKELKPVKLVTPLPEPKRKDEPISENRHTTTTGYFTYEQIVGTLNYFYYKKKEVYELFADWRILLRNLFNEEREIVFDENQFKIRESDGTLSEHMAATKETPYG